MHRSAAAALPRDVSLGYLRAFVTLLVVLHHVLIGYAGMTGGMLGVPGQSPSFTEPPMLWRAFPVVDTAHVWQGALAIVAFNDIYFMSLMFLLSGLFVDASVRRKGVPAFVRDRVVRLGIPWAFAAFAIAPIAYYFAWLQSGGASDLAAWWAAWSGLGDWPTGPAWFILMLLVFDLVIALAYLAAPRWSDAAARLAGAAAGRVLLVVPALMVLALAVYAPLALTFGTEAWFSFGPVQFQIPRVLLYFLFFLMGIGLGTHGIGRGILSHEGGLARSWWLWLAIVSPLAFAGGAVLVMSMISGALAPSPALMLLGLTTFAIGVVATSFGLLGLFVRHVRKANAIWDSFSANAYGIYIVHYAFVAGVQYAMLPVTTMPWLKVLVVASIVIALSWTTSALLRRVPGVSRLVGE
jgi:peptidoglycan/LPS O-acetylase OafA/YrhL